VKSLVAAAVFETSLARAFQGDLFGLILLALACAGAITRLR
jgi:hypothetical protein